MRTAVRAFLALAFLISPAHAKDLTLRAGELLLCTLEEPNFSSASAQVGEPTVCYLGQLREFGHAAFPRGSYLTGRLADSREPGRIVGKGWLDIHFDRLILPDTELPVSTRVVFVRGFKTDAGGRVQGHGHPTRDATLWAIPIFWPVDLLRLPARGPRPALRGEVPITLRLLDDVTLPCYKPGTTSPCR
jgi:hypothetical protein